MVLPQLYIILLLTFIFTINTAETPRRYNKTYIAILTQPNTLYNDFALNFSFENSYIGSSYVKYVEQTGAVPLLVPWDLPFNELASILSETNGLVLPGGSAKLRYKTVSQLPTIYMRRVIEIIQWAKNRNDKDKKYYSIWSVCQGFEEMIIAFGSTKDIEIGFKDSYKVHSIKLNKKVFNASPLFKRQNKFEDIYELTKHRLYFNHDGGITKEGINRDPKLSENIEIIATSVTDNGTEFVSIAEAKKYPFFMVQPHPEKNQFEKKNPKATFINRDNDTIDMTSDFIFAFVALNEEKRNYEIDRQGGLSRKATSYINYNFIVFPSFKILFDSIYMFREMKNCKLRCSQQILSNSYQDEIYQRFIEVRRLKNWSKFYKNGYSAKKNVKKRDLIIPTNKMKRFQG